MIIYSIYSSTIHIDLFSDDYNIDLKVEYFNINKFNIKFKIFSISRN